LDWLGRKAYQVTHIHTKWSLCGIVRLVRNKIIKFQQTLLTYLLLDVLLGSTDYSTSLDIWGVGCIFVEMITGMPTFPGIRDTYDQLDKIFKLLGTPVEETWSGVTHLPSYKPHKLGKK
jgi:serine/threonine protein kinase